MDLCVVIPKIVLALIGCSVFVGEVVESATSETPEMIVAALQRTVVRQPAEVPFADQRRAVSGLFQERGQCWMLRGQSDVLRKPVAREWLLESYRQPALIASSDQGSPTRSAYR